MRREIGKKLRDVSDIEHFESHTVTTKQCIFGMQEDSCNQWESRTAMMPSRRWGLEELWVKSR